MKVTKLKDCGASNAAAKAKPKMMMGGMAMKKKKPAMGYGGMAHKKKK